MALPRCVETRPGKTLTTKMPEGHCWCIPPGAWVPGQRLCDSLRPDPSPGRRPRRLTPPTLQRLACVRCTEKILHSLMMAFFLIARSCDAPWFFYGIFCHGIDPFFIFILAAIPTEPRLFFRPLHPRRAPLIAISSKKINILAEKYALFGFFYCSIRSPNFGMNCSCVKSPFSI